MMTLHEDPAARVMYQGVEYVTDPENLALIIQGKDAVLKATALMRKYNYQYSDIARLNYAELIKEGLSQTQALALISCFQFAIRKEIQGVPEKVQIRSSADAVTLMRPMLSDLPHEERWAVFVNRASRIIKKVKVSQGGINGSVTDVRLIVKAALENLASGILLFHNHPSGSCNPSESDLNSTQNIREAADLFKIELIDHIIIAGEKFYSFADEGLL